MIPLPPEIAVEIEREAEKYLKAVGSVHNKNVIRHDFIEGCELYAQKYLQEKEKVERLEDALYKEMERNELAVNLLKSCKISLAGGDRPELLERINQYITSK